MFAALQFSAGFLDISKVNAIRQAVSRPVQILHLASMGGEVSIFRFVLVSCRERRFNYGQAPGDSEPLSAI